MASFSYKNIGLQLDLENWENVNVNFQKIGVDMNNVQAQISTLVADGDSSPEAAQARVGTDGTTYETLKDRIDVENSNLQNEVSELDVRLTDEVVLARTEQIDSARIDPNSIASSQLRKSSNAERIQLENLSDEVKQAMAGTTPVTATPGVNSVTTEKIVDEAVTLEKLDTRFFDFSTANTITLTNLLPNSNFSSIWTFSTANVSSHTVSANVGSFTASAAGGRINGTLDTVTGHLYYIKASLKASSNLVGINFAGAPKVAHTGSGNFEVVSGINTGLVTGATNLRIQDDRTSGWTQVQAKEVMVIDLTATYGSGNEPTKAQMDSILSLINAQMWFAGSEDYRVELDENELIVYDGLKLTSIPISDFDGASSAGKPMEGQTIVSFGDSITQGQGGNEAATRYTLRMAERLGATVYNAGFGGTRMAYHSLSDYGAFSMYKLADAVVSRDFSLQNTHVATIPSFQSNLDLLKTIDFAQVDYITLMYGANDFGQGVSLDNPSNKKDTNMYLSATRYVIEKLLTAFPHIKLVLITPTWRSRINSNDGLNVDDNPNAIGLYLTQYVDGLKEVGKEYKQPVLDMYYMNFINKQTSTHYLRDGLHPNSNGADLYGSRISGFLEGL